MTRVLIYVQHLQGIGHVVRSGRIAEALSLAGFDVRMVLGGMPINGLDAPAVETIQLPPLKAGSRSFRELLTSDGMPADDTFKTRRRDLLLEVFADSAPDVLLIEAFPFDRPQMHFELLPLLAAAKTQARVPLVISSIRDILQLKPDPQRDHDALALLTAHFDHVLVHGDPNLAHLDETFRHAAAIAHMTSYTGIVAPLPASDVAPEETFDVVVSTGGGATDGHRTLAAAMRAKRHSSLAEGRWLALTGPFIDSGEHAPLIEIARESEITVRPFQPGLATLLANARVSISQAGYNTVADVLRAGCAAVLCPYDGIRQNEQTRRAERLAERGWARCVSAAELAPEAIARAIDASLDQPRPPTPIDLDGARGTATAIRRLVSARQEL